MSIPMTEDLACFDAAGSWRRFRIRLGQGGALATLTRFGAGTDAARHGFFGRGLVPVAWAEEAPPIPAKPGMMVHHDRPIKGQLPSHLLDDPVTP